jgi:16S rRNA (guanine1516-N2)-methyltransferase
MISKRLHLAVLKFKRGKGIIMESVKGIYISEKEDEEKGRLISKKLCVPVLSESPCEELYLCIEGGRLYLKKGSLAMCGDFSAEKGRLKMQRLNSELLVKAAAIKNADHPLNIIDATAGMGEDSLLLAAAGHNVYMFERNPVIAALLFDALQRAALDPDLSAAAGRMKLTAGDFISSPKPCIPDIVFLDPMFPAREKSGLIKKKFQLLKLLESPCSDEKELLDAALSCAPKKVIIKRPLKAPYLAGVKPMYDIKGSTIRYDCFYFEKKIDSAR